MGPPRIISLLFCIAAAITLSGLFAQQASPAASAFAGSAVCRTCHPNVALQFFRNPHNKSSVASNVKAENAGCEGCHGPAKAHVDAKGGKETIVAFSTLTPNQALDACLRCHAKDANRANIRRSNHSQANVVCTSCHSIHQSDSSKGLLAKKQADVCYGCHNDVRAQFSMPFKHRVNEGFMTCSDCHNPHGTNAPVWKTGRRPHLVDTGLQNEQACMKCHTDKRGPFLFEHAAVRVDGCETCHSPHGSTNARLLKRPVVFTVCLECHNGAGSFGRQSDGVATQSVSHNMADPRYRNCTTCHIRIHGSNSDRTFLR
ncbi:MAG: DmsE family decaheme c-type cytochrome [Bryobacterales bacterium]|nr:DmsE family decaheme c-type cytochrome [Bryobacterales bacterium]